MGSADVTRDICRDKRAKTEHDGSKTARRISRPGIVEITTKNGKKYRCEVLRPKGHPMNPMTDADVENKFRSMAGKLMDEQQMRQIIDTVYRLDTLNDIGELVKLLVVPEQRL